MRGLAEMRRGAAHRRKHREAAGTIEADAEMSTARKRTVGHALCLGLVLFQRDDVRTLEDVCILMRHLPAQTREKATSQLTKPHTVAIGSTLPCPDGACDDGRAVSAAGRRKRGTIASHGLASAKLDDFRYFSVAAACTRRCADHSPVCRGSYERAASESGKSDNAGGDQWPLVGRNAALVHSPRKMVPGFQEPRA
jgi:hypothetical protein